MTLVVSGLSHQTSELALRERVAFSEEVLPGALLRLRKQLDGAGAVIVSTCNRSEIYVSHAGAPEDLLQEIRKFWRDSHGLEDGEFVDSLYEYDHREAVGHLFRVASSLDSLVVGEGQILGQVHDAYQVAQSEQSTDKVTNSLFQRAFAVAKRVRDKTDIGLGKVSISSVAVNLAASIFGDLSGKTVLVVGSGEMGELTLKSLVDQGAGHVIVVNRTVEKAAELAAHYDGEYVGLADLGERLHDADIVITSTGAPGTVLHEEDFHAALRRRDNEPMFVIDIAMPRDVDASVNHFDDVYLYDIDDLQEVAEQNMETRRAEVDRCLEIVEEGVEQFCKWLSTLA
ncbi:MAG: glutamyl-tRNA reductase, partial [Candidatus Hydrogenedentes bacterium]|nr:glutamyl-tRNA reductase [Candidatus Hydrogenedentota bacterium]